MSHINTNPISSSTTSTTLVAQLILLKNNNLSLISYFVTGDPLKLDKTGFSFILLQLVCLLYMIWVTNFYFAVSFKYKLIYVMQIMTICVFACVRSAVVLLNTILMRTKRAIRLLNEAVRLTRSIQSRRSFITEYFFTCFILVAGTLPILLRLPSSSFPSHSITFALSNLQEQGVIVLFYLVVVVVSSTLSDINRKLEGLERMGELKSLMRLHWRACGLVDDLGHCCGLDLAVLYVYNLSKTVLLVYYSYFIIVTGSHDYMNHFIAITDVPYRFFYMWYIGRKCDSILRQVSLSL